MQGSWRRVPAGEGRDRFELTTLGSRECECAAVAPGPEGRGGAVTLLKSNNDSLPINSLMRIFSSLPLFSLLPPSLLTIFIGVEDLPDYIYLKTRDLNGRGVVGFTEKLILGDHVRFGPLARSAQHSPIRGDMQQHICRVSEIKD